MTKNYNLFILFLKDADPVSKGPAGSENRTILNSDFFFFSQSNLLKIFFILSPVLLYNFKSN